MPDTHAIKYLHSDMRGAPVLSGTAGTLIAALDALLINGWGSATAVSVSVAAGVATATFGSPTAWEVGAVIDVSGATPAALNGPARVLSSEGPTLAFATAAADGAATGTIAIKYAPAGWQKPYIGTNIAAYRSQDTQSPKHYLRVRDSYGKYATVCGYEAMTAISTGTGRFARHTSLDSNQSTWEKSMQADATPVPYLVAADARAVLVSMACGVPASEAYSAANVRGFGDPLALGPSGDAWCTFLSAASYDANGTDSGALSGRDDSYYGSLVAPRQANGTGVVQSLRVMPLIGSGSLVSGDDDTLGPAPSSIDGSLMLSRIRLALADKTSRAFAPGVWHVPQKGLLSIFSAGDVYRGSGDLGGRRLRAVHVGSNAYGVSGIAFVDLTGPWR